MAEFIIPPRPRDLGIPKDEWREGQVDTIRDVLNAFLSGKKYVMLSAPTGSGKSVIAAAVQKLLARAGGSGEGRSVALTHTIQLQQQYMDTLPDSAVITGRRNYDCELPEEHPARFGFPRLSADDAPCSTGDGCDSKLNTKNGCGYYSQFWEAAEAPMVTMNYAYASRIMQQEWFSTGEKDGDKPKAIRNPFRRSLLVADECHLAERAIVEAAGFTMNMRLLTEAGVALPSTYTRQNITEGDKVKSYETVGVWSAWARATIPVIEQWLGRMTEKGQFLKAKKETYDKEREELGLLQVKSKRVSLLLQSLKILGGLEALHYAEWHVTRDFGFGSKTITGVTVRPLWGWTVAQGSLWQWFDRVLLMSATPGEPTIERIKLGIPEEEFEFIECPSTFPVKNRPVYYWPVAKLNYRSTDAEWTQVARAILQIAGSGTWSQRKGLIHTGSKVNAERLVTMLKGMGETRFFTHGSGKGDAQAALEAYKRSPEPLVMVTASFTTGLDLPYLIGWQIIAKVPYGSLADEVTARRRAFKDANGVDFGQRVYQSEAMNTVVQAAGRIVRAQDDSGPTFILDGNYQLLHRLAWKPRFYTEAYQQLSVGG